MPPRDDDELRDIRAEEESRGRKRPTNTVSRARERRVRHLMNLLLDPRCTLADFLDVIRGYGIKDESAEFRQLYELWKSRRGSA